MRKFDKKRPDKFIFDFGQIRAFERYNFSCPLALFVGRCKKRQEHKEMSAIFSQIPARLWRTLGRLVGPAGVVLFSLVLASCAGGGFGGTGDAGNAPDIPGVNSVSQPAPAASGPISPASQRKVAEAVSGLDLGEETPPISPEDIAVSNDSGILDSNPFSSSVPAARSSGWGARADSTRKTQGYKAFEVAVPSENPLMTVAVWISETPPDYPEGKPEQDPEADRKFLYLRLRVFIEVGNVALVEGGGVEVLETNVIVVEEKRPDPNPQPQPTVVAEPQPACGTGEFRDGEGGCAPILGADLLCPSGTMPANGLTQEELDAGLFDAGQGSDDNAWKVCEYLRRGANIHATDVQDFSPILRAFQSGFSLPLKVLAANGANVNDRQPPARLYSLLDSAAFWISRGKNLPLYGKKALILREAGATCHYLDPQQYPACLGSSDSGSVPVATPDPVTLEAVTAETVCESGSLSADGQTQAQLDAGLISEVEDNDLEGACEYLRKGADIEVVYTPALRSGDAIKRTPLVVAAANGRLELSRFLLNNGANVDWQSGRTLPESDYDGGAGWSALALAAAAGHGDVVGLLLDQGANVDIQWDFGRTALHEAAIFGRASVVELLLARGAAVDVRDLNGETALHGAAWGASPGGHHTHVSRSTWEAKWDKALDLLLDAGAEVNLRSTRTSDWGHGGRVFVNEGWNGGWTPLDRAIAANKRSRALKLRSRGGVCNVQSGSLCPPTSVAVGFSSSGSGTVSAEGEGGALSDGDEVRQGATVIFTATPAAGHYVSGWSGNCAEAGEVADGLDGAAKSCAAAADSALSVRAEFSEIPSLAGPLCPSGSLSANGLTQAELDAGLVSAAQANNLEDVCEHLRRGASVEAQEQSGTYRRTALMIAAYDRYLDLAKLLHANGADVNSRVGNGGGGGTAWPGRWNTHADTGFTALMYAAGAAGSAAAAGRAEMVGWLLDNGADPNLGDSRGRLPLWEAAHYGRVDVMGLLLDGGADVDGADVWGVVPLQAAGPHYDRFSKWSFAATVVGYLLSRGAEVNARDIWGRSPLDVYAEWSHRNVAAVLRNAGGKCFVQTGPLCGVDVAVDFSSSGSGTVSAEGDGDALSDGGEVRQGATVVFTATPAAGHYVSGWSGHCADAGGVADGLDGTAKSCAVSADSDLSVRAEFSEIPSLAGPLCPSGSLSANGMTQAELDAELLLAAKGFARWNHVAEVCEALRRGADIKAQDRFRPAPFAFINARASDGAHRRTPLMLAAVNNRMESARLLVENGADVNYQSGGSDPDHWDGAGWSALMYAAGAGHVEMVAYLLDQGAEIDMQWASGYSALHEAALWARWETVELLIERGANVNLRDHVVGETPLHAASWGRMRGVHNTSVNPNRRVSWSKVIKALLDAGSEVNALSTRTSDWDPVARVYVDKGWSGGRTPLDRAVAENRRSQSFGWAIAADQRARALLLRSHGGVCNVESGPLCPPSLVAVNFSSSGAGTVSAEGDGGALSDGGEVRQGATVMFTATPAAGHYVSGWSGNCADAGGVADGLDGTVKSCAVSADSDLSVRAEFSEIPSLAGPLCPSGSLSANGLTAAELNMTLRLAARGGDAARACEALRRGAEVNDNLDDSEFTPLQEAVSGGHLEAVKILLANGAEVNKRKGGTEHSPLDLAARDSEAEIAALLRDAEGRCFLETGALCGSVPAATPDPATVAGTVAATVVATVAAGSCPAGTLDANGLTQAQLDAGLILAAQENDATGACEHMRRGANVNAQDDEGGAPLHHTTRRSPVTGLLLDNGANINATDNNGRTPLHRALKYRNIDYWKTRRLLERGADADAPDGEGNRPMHLAIADGWYNVIRMLLDHGADIEGGNSAGETPLHRAAIVDKYNIVRLLADRGADLNSSDNNGRTPLHRAVGDYHRYNGRYIVVRNMIRRGADVNARGDDGRTPLDLATVGRIARLLTDAGGVCYIGENAHCGSAGLVGVDFSAAGSGEIAAHVGDRALTSGERVQKGVTVVFAATPGAGGRVKRWSGACAGIGLSGRVGDDSVKSCRVTVETAVNAGVFFASASVAADAPLSCPSGSLSADGLTQAGLNAGLVSAAQANNLEEACEYLRRGADVNARYSSSFADVLTAMSFNERLELARLLVANGADVDGLGHSSPLGYAAYFGYVGIARHLLENGANVNRKSHDLTPLDELADSRVREKPEGAEMSALLRSRGGVCGRRTHWVCSGPASVVYAATTTTTVTVTTRVEDSSSPLVLAGDVAGETTVISSVSTPVLTGGAAVTARVTEYFVRRVTVIPTTTTATIRIETVETENPGDSTSELIALSTVTNQSPPGIVVEVEEFRRVYERPADGATVAATVANTVASTVVADSCPTESLPANGLTQAELNAGLLSAARAGNKEDGCEYLRRGADVNAKADSKWTALIYAAWNDSPQLAALLIDRGVNVNAQSKNGWVALHMAVQKPHIIRLLLENGANTEIKNQHGRTPLNWTAYTGTYEAVRELVAGGADVSSKNNDDGWAPLHYTARSNLSAKTMELLIANGADVNATTNDGETPLDIARRYGKSAIIAILEAAMDPVTVTVAATTLAAQADSAPDTSALTDRLRERFSGAFNPSPAFGDAFGAVSGSSESFLTRLNSLMRSSAGAGGSAWDSFSGWQRENEHGRMWFSTGQRGDFGFGAGGNGAGGDLSASPFAALVENGMLAGGETGFAADGKLRVAAFADYQAKSLLDGEDKQWTQWAARGTAIETAMTEAERFSGLSENQTRGAMTEIHLGGGDLGVALQAGAVSESDSVLSGTAGDENLRGLSSRTAFAGLSGAADLFGSGWRLRGSAHLGRSWAESEGMLRDSDLWASAFSAGLERGGWLYSDDGFVLRFSQPLRVESLEMGLIGDGGAGRLGADPSGRQLDVDAAYRLPLSGGGWLLLSAGVRRDGGHSSSSDLEAGALFSVERGF